MPDHLPFTATDGDSGPVRRGNLLAANCPSRDLLHHVTGRWGLLVLLALQDGRLRFRDLRQTIGGISERMLVQTLQGLETDGLVAREAQKVGPPHVEYSLTPLGAEAAEKVRQLADWIEANVPAITGRRNENLHPE